MGKPSGAGRPGGPPQGTVPRSATQMPPKTDKVSAQTPQPQKQVKEEPASNVPRAPPIEHYHSWIRKEPFGAAAQIESKIAKLRSRINKMILHSGIQDFTKHFQNANLLFEAFKRGYKYPDSKKVIERLIAVEKRGRYKH